MVGEASNREGQASPLPADVAVFPARGHLERRACKFSPMSWHIDKKLVAVKKNVKMKMLLDKNKPHKKYH